jgi:mannose-6-phosphate isomerase-like protein (cupin superfamily)
MTNKEWQERLRQEGFSHIFVWQDGPSVFYPDHTHTTTTAHIILGGEMSLTSDGKTQTFRKGERFDVPANTVHSAKMGPEGCKYMIGEKPASSTPAAGGIEL